MPILYRVLPFVAEAAHNEPGGVMYIPPQGGGRLDNPELYAVLYLSDAPSGAMAEAFGRVLLWSPAMLTGNPGLPGSSQALASYRLDDDAPLCDLDDIEQLRDLLLRPSDVVSRDYRRTRTWARRIYERRAWVGVRWWSYYDPRWTSIGLWKLSSLELLDVRPLRLDEPALTDAGRIIARRISDSESKF